MRHLYTKSDLEDFDKQGRFSGYGGVFGNKDLGGDILMPDAVKEVELTKSGDLRITEYHDLHRIVGKAQQHSDNFGIKVEGELFLGLSYAADMYELMKNDAIDGMSIGYHILPNGINEVADTDGSFAWELSAIKLVEVALVPFGMNPLAKVEEVKSAQNIKTAREFEQFLRTEGFTKREAERITTKGFTNALGEPAPSRGEPEYQSGDLQLLRSFIKEIEV